MQKPPFDEKSQKLEKNIINGEFNQVTGPFSQGLKELIHDCL
jgi:hypothetical protein